MISAGKVLYAESEIHVVWYVAESAVYLVCTKREAAKQQWMKRITHIYWILAMLFDPQHKHLRQWIFEYNFSLWLMKKWKVSEIS